MNVEDRIEYAREADLLKRKNLALFLVLTALLVCVALWVETRYATLVFLFCIFAALCLIAERLRHQFFWRRTTSDAFDEIVRSLKRIEERNSIGR